MEKKSCDKCVKWLCAILFSVFAFCWLYFFQRDLLCAAYNKLLYGLENPAGHHIHNHFIVSLLLTIFAQFLIIPGRFILRFKKGLYACNYLLSAVFLGIVTGYDGDSFIGQSSVVWILTTVFTVLLVFISKLVGSIPRSEYNDRPRTLMGNLMLMFLLFCLVGLLGNTDENLHRRLRMESLYSDAEYSAILEIGRYEEESDPAIDLLRAKAMLNIAIETNPAGSGIGENLFRYSISDPHALAVALKQEGGHEAYLASCLLDGDMDEFRKSIDLNSYKSVPEYYMQALVMAADSAAQNMFPTHYANVKSVYDKFIRALEPLSRESSVFRSNSTFVEYHETYFWFNQFCIR